MGKYMKPYLPYAILAGLFMIGEVMMDLIQPGIMSQIVDDGVLGLNTGGTGDLSLIWRLGIQMIGLVLFGGLCGSLNNVFVHMSAQNVGNDMRKDCFRKVMTFSFPQLDEYGTGSLVTRVTNDITQVQNFVAQFVRGMIRTLMLTFGSMFCIFRLNRDFGLVTVCAFPFIAGCLAFCLNRANPLFSRLQAQLDAINAIMQEDIAGIRTMKWQSWGPPGAGRLPAALHCKGHPETGGDSDTGRLHQRPGLKDGVRLLRSFTGIQPSEHQDHHRPADCLRAAGGQDPCAGERQNPGQRHPRGASGILWGLSGNLPFPDGRGG